MPSEVKYRITAEDNTDKGTAEATANLKKIGTTAQESSNKSTTSFDKAHEGLTKFVKQIFTVGLAIQFFRDGINKLKASNDPMAASVKSMTDSFDKFQISVVKGIAPLAPIFANAAKSMEQFFNDTGKMNEYRQGIANLGGTINVIVSVISQLVDIYKNYLSSIWDSFKEGLGKVAGKGNEANSVFLVLGGVIQVISAGMAITARIINLVIQSIADLINAVMKSVDVLGAFGAAMADPLNSKKWEAVSQKGQIAVNAFADFGKNIVKNFGGIIDQTQKEINSFFDNSEKRGKEFQKTFVQGQSAVLNAAQGSTARGFDVRNYQEGSEKYAGMGGYRGSEGEGKRGSMSGVMDALGSFTSGLLGAFLQIENVVAVLNPLTTIIQGFSEIISGPVNKALQPIVNLLKWLGKAIGEVLLPVIEFFGNIILGIAKFIATIFNGIAAVINFLLGWAGVHISYIDTNNMGATSGEATSTGSSGGGSGGTTTAQYTAAPVITMNINIYATAITAGDKIMTLEDLALLLEQKAREAMELR